MRVNASWRSANWTPTHLLALIALPDQAARVVLSA